jgi:hypothetical protein
VTHEQRQLREQQLRILLACGERGPILQRIFGVSARTIKRLVRHTAMAVPTGRSAAPSRGWLGRNRHVVENLLQRWLYEGLDKLLAGEAPSWLRELARHTGQPNAAVIAAMMQRMVVQADETTTYPGSSVLVHIYVCAHCQLPFISIHRDGGPPHSLSPCPNPICRGGSVSAARITDLADWRQRRARHEEQR